MSEPFRYYLRVRYGECDAQKVVFNARYSDYADVALVEFIKASCSDLGYFEFHLVKQTVEWKAPARFDQALELTVALRQLGVTSFTFDIEIRVAGQEPVITRIETVCVYIDHIAMKKEAIPDTVRAALLKGAPGAVVDHAAYFPKDGQAGAKLATD